jgi:carboxyl-terminal processing protease
MIDDKTGYIKVSRFAKTTYSEFREAGEKLLQQGMSKLILDLRGNGGGFMDGAIRIADEFLAAGKMIVYTEGRARPREEHYATDEGILENVDLAILINESSASASEIVAGAIQDNDRGTIYGKRSFGKGLVQEQTGWPDGSATRLTIARYYTPTGRCIQRPYSEGSEQYHQEIINRFEQGELTDSSKIENGDSIPYITPGGKTVYGGGGITPDVFVPLDTTGSSLYLTHLYYNGIFYQFAFEYTDTHREELQSYQSPFDFISNFKVAGEVENQFYAFAEEKGMRKDEEGIEKSRGQILFRLKAGIARNLFGDAGYYPIVNKNDEVVKTAFKDLRSRRVESN